MQSPLEVETAIEYFDKTNQKIDWDETNNSKKIQLNEADKISEILAIEASIYLLRRSNQFCGSLIDILVKLRRDLITTYESTYQKKYTEYNDFY